MDTPKFSLKGYTVKAKIVKVYDGDTITAVFPLPMHENSENYKWSCRINGIDTPEMRSKDTELKKIAVQARELVKSLILNKTVNLELDNFDKYGRVLCNAFDINGKSIAKTLIEEGLAKEYDGGKKQKW
ncbi:MAG: thermonuclease family protein [Arcobacter sp.]|nr:thermonuclease family protein [Flavobacteriaceae bacterium]MCP4970564.1 thermonuclease family protein [Arcobacter sp.]